MSAKAKSVKQLDKVYLVRDKTGTAGNTTLSAAAAAGAGTITVTAATNIESGDLIRVGEGEEMELCVVNGAPAGTTVTLTNALVKDHASGAAVREQTAYELGDIEQGGATATFTGESADVLVSTRRLTFTKLNGYVSADMAFTMPGFTPTLFAVATGIPLASVAGDGTAATPYALATDGNDFGDETNMSLVGVGILQDGTYVRIELWGCDMDYTQLQMQFRRGQLTGLPVRGVAAAGGLISTALPTFTPDTSLRVTKGQVWDALTEVGIFVDSATEDTLAGDGVAAGELTLDLDDSTGFAADDWVRVSSEDTVEYHQVDNVALNVVTLRSPVLRAHAVGTAIVKVTETALAGVSEDGVTLATGGTVTPIRTATSAFSAGLRLGNVLLSVAVGLFEFSLANFARALGIPQASIVGGRLPVLDDIGTESIDGFYFRGLLKDGSLARVNAWGCTSVVAQVAATLNNSGTPPTLPISLQPSSGIQFLQQAA